MQKNENFIENIELIHKTDDFLIINKPAGVITHPVKPELLKEDKNSVTFWILNNFPEIKNIGDRPDWRPGIVHRLDRDTSGILVIARNQKFFDYFKDLLKERNITKTYEALLWGKIEEKGRVEDPIGLKPNTTRWSTRGKNLKMIKNALTLYNPIKIYKYNDEFFTLTELQPKTGRTHQLRVHMASIHKSVVGDQIYGKKGTIFDLKRQFLHAKSIRFNDLDGKELKFEAPLTKDLKGIIKLLERNNE
jgi:23S rRNA pseudouridine1911/1915/1917 synthase